MSRTPTHATLTKRMDMGDTDRQAQMGHADYKMTMHYTDPDLQRRRLVVDGMANLLLSGCVTASAQQESGLTLDDTKAGDSNPAEVVDLIGRGGEIRTHDPLRPRQVRYQAALRPDMYCSLHSKTLLDSPHFRDEDKNYLKQARPWQNRDKTPSVRPLRVKTPAALIRLPVQLLQRLPFHLQLHL